MRSKVLAALRNLTVPGQTVTCALSGGADSVAMTHCVASLQAELGITAAACHFNHHLRGEESNSDESFCRELCASLGIPLTCGNGDVKARMAQTGESLEEAARILRYEFFAAQTGLVATAHTADDNAETVLLNLVRGTGLKGLCGIPAQRDTLIRPLLSVTREEILAYLEMQNLPHRQDSTNATDDCLRNRLRHHVLPLLKTENPSFPESIRRMTETLRQDEILLQSMADDLCSVTDLQNAPQPLRRRSLRSLLRNIPKLTHAHIEAAEAIVLGSDPSAGICLPDGKILRREYDRLVLEESSENATFSPVTLPCPGSVTVKELGITFTAAASGSPIEIRPRKQGDTITLSGGSKSVKKLLIDKKIPAIRREMIPILEQDGNIISVWGVADAMPLFITAEEERGDR